MLGVRLVRLALLLILTITIPRAAAAPGPAPAGWAVLMEHNAFHGRYPDLPVGYINSTRMLTLLFHRGWPADHILLKRDAQDADALPRAIRWLASHAGPDDETIFYVASEYRFLERDLAWNTSFPKLWSTIPTSHRVLIVETCYAERFTDAVRSAPGLGLPAVGRQELDWWGLREGNGLIRGGTFTFFLARALSAQPAGAPLDFPGAFDQAVADARDYFRTVIAHTPAALGTFHSLGSFPERLTTFPNPDLTRGVDDSVSPAAVTTH